MSQVYTINPNSSLKLDREVAEIQCQVGAVSAVDASEEVAAIEQGGSFTPAPGFVNVSSLLGANILVTYADEVETSRPPERGDSGGGDSGGLESRTKEQLYKPAAKKKIAGRSSMDKDELIAALRAAE